MKAKNIEDIKLLLASISHPSFTNGSGNPHYNRLEFLGDRVVSFVVADFLYDNFPDYPEGKLSSVIDMLICGKNMERKALELQLDKKALIDPSVELNEKILADLYESDIGGVYKIEGLQKAKERVEKDLLTVDQIKKAEYVFSRRSQKAILIKQLLHNSIPISPECRLLSKTADPVTFRIGIYVKEHLLAEGEAADEKTAAEVAAKEAVQKSSQWKKQEWQSLREILGVAASKKKK